MATKKFDPQSAGAAADEMIKNLQTAKTEQAGDQAAAADNAQEPTTVVPDATPAPVPQAAAPAPQSNVEVDLLKQQLSESEQRWKTLQGMLAKRDSEVDQMRQLLATLQAPAPEPIRPEAFVTKADEDAFGADMIDLNRRVAKETVTAEVLELKNYIAKLEDKLGLVSQATVASAQDRFEVNMDRVVPSWRQINEDPNFIQWLGKYRLAAMREAYKEFDVNGVAEFFNDFVRTLAPAKATEPTPPMPSADEIVSPSKGTSSSTPAPAQEHLWTRDEIRRLYQDKQEGRVTAAEFAKAEAEIFKQANAGKIAA